MLKRVGGLLALVTTILGGAAAAATKAPVAPPAPAASPADSAGYTFCMREANDALTLARLVINSGLTREQASAAEDLPAYLRAMAGNLFDERAAGRAPTHVHFATTRLKTCLKTQQVPLDVPDERLFSCLSRADIPFYFMVLRQDNVKPDEAVARLKKALAPWRHPDALIEALAEPAYTAASEADVTALQLLLVNGCLLPPDQVSALYGFPPLPTGTPAPAATPEAAPPARSRPAPTR